MRPRQYQSDIAEPIVNDVLKDRIDRIAFCKLFQIRIFVDDNIERFVQCVEILKDILKRRKSYLNGKDMCGNKRGYKSVYILLQRSLQAFVINGFIRAFFQCLQNQRCFPHFSLSVNKHAPVPFFQYGSNCAQFPISAYKHSDHL